MYEIVMPQLSDSMDEGKLIAWKVNIGQEVKSGDVIAEVESDKAIMEVETFKDGVVKELLVKEGEEAKIGSVIARIETDKKSSEKQVKVPQEVKKEKAKQEETQEIQAKPEFDMRPKKAQSVKKQSDETVKNISPKARAKAASYGFDIADIIDKSKEEIVHAKDVQAYANEKYFTPKALRLLQAYQLETSLFELNHKIDATEVQNYIDEHEIPLPKPLSGMQKAIIANVSASAKKPIFHIYETVDATLLKEHKEKSITLWLLKIIAKVMMAHEAFRSKLVDNAVVIMPNASISLAVADNKNLYMPVIKDANRLSVDAMAKELQNFKQKLQTASFTQTDMQGGTFGISNLGMLGVERFDAMINKDESAIVAVGAERNGKIAVTLTIDHRLINGYEAALFINDVKKEVLNPLNYKEIGYNI